MACLLVSFGMVDLSPNPIGFVVMVRRADRYCKLGSHNHPTTFAGPGTDLFVTGAENGEPL